VHVGSSVGLLVDERSLNWTARAGQHLTIELDKSPFGFMPDEIGALPCFSPVGK
jgi:hypothetical protein